MALFEHFPFVNMHNINLDWILTKVQALLGRMDTAESDIDDLEAHMSAAEENISGLDDRLTAAESDIDAAESDIDTLQTFVPTTGGTSGQVLTRTSAGASWQDVPEELPPWTSSNEGNRLTIDSVGNLIWDAAELPAYSSADWDKMLIVKQNGTLQWTGSIVNQMETMSRQLAVLTQTKVVSNDTAFTVSTNDASIRWCCYQVQGLMFHGIAQIDLPDTPGFHSFYLYLGSDGKLAPALGEVNNETPLANIYCCNVDTSGSYTNICQTVDVQIEASDPGRPYIDIDAGLAGDYITVECTYLLANPLTPVT